MHLKKSKYPVPGWYIIISDALKQCSAWLIKFKLLSKKKLVINHVKICD